jgi:hypothetical protein
MRRTAGRGGGRTSARAGPGPRDLAREAFGRAWDTDTGREMRAGGPGNQGTDKRSKRAGPGTGDQATETRPLIVRS